MKITKEFWLSSVSDEPVTIMHPALKMVRLYVPIFLKHIGQKDCIHFSAMPDAPELVCFENSLTRNEAVSGKLCRLMGQRAGSKIGRIFSVTLELVEGHGENGGFIRLLEKGESWLIPGMRTIRNYSISFRGQFNGKDRYTQLLELEISLNKEEYDALMESRGRKYSVRLEFQEIPPEKSKGVREAIRLERKQKADWLS